MSTRLKKSKMKRRQPALRVLREITELDPNGVEVTHHRTVDTLGLMLELGRDHLGHACCCPRLPGRLYHRLL